MGTDTTLPPTTPERPRHAGQQNADTPIARKQTPSVHGAAYSLDVSRGAVLNDFGLSIPQVPIQYFKDSILPPLPDKVDTAKVVAALKDSGHITASGRWKVFPDDPKSCKGEAETFDHLGQVVKAMLKKSGMKNKRTTVTYTSKPYHIPRCDYVNKESKPDAFLVFRKRVPTKQADGSRCKGDQWRDICCPAEFKLNDGNDELADVSDSTLLQTCADSLTGCEEDLLEHVSGDARGCPSPIRRCVHDREHDDASLVWQQEGNNGVRTIQLYYCKFSYLRPS